MRYWVTIALLLGAEAYAAQQQGQADRTQPPAPIDAASIDNPSQPELDVGTKGSGVVRAQILLDRAHFSSGQIDGDFGTNLQKTLSAYQEEHGMTQTGRLDAATWTALNADTAPALTSYTISADDEKGPFVSVPSDLMKQARLPYLGYASPLEELGERFHARPALLKDLNRAADFTAPGQQITVPNVLVMPPPGPAALIVISKEEGSLRAYDASNKLLAFYMATLGSSHDPLPLGHWKVTTIERNPKFHYDASLFWDAKDPTDRATIQPGPRNPVGVAKVGISKPHYGIHGTPDASKIGHSFSHGCIRLPNWNASELALLVKSGVSVICKE
jgi:lipoprotein-anchoring transpeptidase ErfK/SrfK